MRKIKFDSTALTHTETFLIIRVSIGCTELSAATLQRYERNSQRKLPQGISYEVGEFLLPFLLKKCGEREIGRLVSRSDIALEVERTLGTRVAPYNVSRELAFLNKLGLVERVKGPAAKEWAHPGKGKKKERRRGPKKYYRISESLCTNSQTLSTPRVRMALYAFLMESGVLPRYLINNVLSLLHFVQSNGKNVEAVQRLAAPYKEVIPYQDVETLHAQVKGLREKRLREIAGHFVANFLRKETGGYNSTLFTEFYVRGLIHFDVMEAGSGLPQAGSVSPDRTHQRHDAFKQAG